MTIGNIKSATCGKPSQFATVLLALLPVPPKAVAGSGQEGAQFRQLKVEVHHEILDKILSLLREVYRDGVHIRCIDMKYRQCFPVLAAWPADHMEYVKLFNVNQQLCLVCIILQKSLGDGNDQIYPA